MNTNTHQRLLVDGIRNGFWRSGPVRSVEPYGESYHSHPLYAKVRMQTTWIVAGGENETSVGHSVLTRTTSQTEGTRLPNDARHGWRRHET